MASIALGYLYNDQKTKIAELTAQLDSATTELASIKAAAEAAGDYEQTATSVIRSILASAANAESVCGEIKKRWRQAVTDRKDINEAIDSALNAKRYNVNTLKKQRDEIAVAMTNLRTPPEALRNLHEKTVDLYGQYEKYVSMAISPSGSLISYNQGEDEVKGDLLRLVSEAKAMAGM
ncbi:MAG: hypothetical protein C0621_05705 [Desulfuromonas sp.]|nr:MAG: hypothetical protein C0621_05705 [Desulfuromonas sp.]